MKLLLKALTWFPLWMVYPWGWILYFITFRVLRWRRRRVVEDIARAFPDKSPAECFEIARRMYRNLGDGLIEALWGYGASAEEFRRRVVMENPELVQHYANAGKTVLLLTAHVCNWEWLFLGAGAHFGIPIDVVYRRQGLDSVDEYVRDARARFGGRVIPREDFIFEIMKWSGEPRAYALVADQTPKHHETRHWTRFLNQDTAFFLGAGKIANFMQAPVLYVAMRRIRRGYYSVRLWVLAEPPYDVGSDVLISERYARSLESEILANPSDWLWLQKKWKYPKQPGE
ncbi:MAG TPA: lysophospholipid acyltransferase family protein [Casimicrobiaceae bacterium]|nr:lysophospholipid acyltransferase family protein [Casimicrobiaceae bacterium]